MNVAYNKAALIVECGARLNRIGNRLNCDVDPSPEQIVKMAEIKESIGVWVCPCSVVVEGFPVKRCPCREGIQDVKNGGNCHCGILKGVRK